MGYGILSIHRPPLGGLECANEIKCKSRQGRSVYSRKDIFTLTVLAGYVLFIGIRGFYGAGMVNVFYLSSGRLQEAWEIFKLPLAERI